MRGRGGLGRAGAARGSGGAPRRRAGGRAPAWEVAPRRDERRVAAGGGGGVGAGGREWRCRQGRGVTSHILEPLSHGLSPTLHNVQAAMVGHERGRFLMRPCRRYVKRPPSSEVSTSKIYTAPRVWAVGRPAPGRSSSSASRSVGP